MKKMIRKIITIDEEKCNGCGLCVDACHEGAIVMVDGKAKLLSDEYCDGLGDCLPECPTDAITMDEREAKAFDKELVEERMKEIAKEKLDLKNTPPQFKDISLNTGSELRQWPVQLSLVHTRAPYLEGSDLLVAADCTAFAYSRFHEDFIKGRVVLVGCPKLDNTNYYIEKLTEMFKINTFKSITVVRMEVPCCSGITYAVKEAMLKSENIVPYSEITVTTDGRLIK